jgi:dynamin GTPase
MKRKWQWNFVFLQPTGENGATRAPICIDLQRDTSLSSKSIILQIDNKSQQVSASKLLLFSKSYRSKWLICAFLWGFDYWLIAYVFIFIWFVLFSAGALRHSLQDRLSKATSAKARDQITLKLRTSTGLYMNVWWLILVTLMCFIYAYLRR